MLILLSTFLLRQKADQPWICSRSESQQRWLAAQGSVRVCSSYLSFNRLSISIASFAKRWTLRTLAICLDFDLSTSFSGVKSFSHCSLIFTAATLALHHHLSILDQSLQRHAHSYHFSYCTSTNLTIKKMGVQANGEVARNVDVDPFFDNTKLVYGDAGYKVPYTPQNTYKDPNGDRQDYLEKTKGLTAMQKVSYTSSNSI